MPSVLGISVDFFAKTAGADSEQDYRWLPVSAKAVLPKVLNESHYHEPQCLLC